MADCALKKPERHESPNPSRNAPVPRAMALAFTLHDYALDLYGFSHFRSPQMQANVYDVLSMIEAQIHAYRLNAPPPEKAVKP